MPPPELRATVLLMSVRVPWWVKRPPPEFCATVLFVSVSVPW
jgi:hypothetical protein